MQQAAVWAAVGGGAQLRETAWAQGGEGIERAEAGLLLITPR